MMRFLSRLTLVFLIIGIIAVALLPKAGKEAAWSLGLFYTTFIARAGDKYRNYLSSPFDRRLTPDTPSLAEELAAHPDDLDLLTGGFLAFRSWIIPPERPDDVAARIREADNKGPVQYAALCLLLPDAVKDAERVEMMVMPESPLPAGYVLEEIVLPDDVLEEWLPWLDEWAAVEPENAFPDVLASYLLFCAKKDAAALARAEKAAGKPYCTIHELEFQEVLYRLFAERGLPEADSTLAGSNISPLGLYSDLRRWAYIMTNLGREEYDAGDVENAFRYWEIVGEVGNLLLSTPGTNISRLIGISIQDIGFRPIFEKEPVSLVEREVRPGKAHDEYVAIRGKARGAEVEKLLVSGETIFEEIGKVNYTPGYTLGLRYFNYVAARTINLIALPALILAAVLWMTLSGIVRLRRAYLKRPGAAATVAIVALLPLLFFASVELLHLAEETVFSAAMKTAGPEWVRVGLLSQPDRDQTISQMPLSQRLAIRFIESALVEKLRIGATGVNIPDTPAVNLALIFSAPLLVFLMAVLWSGRIAQAEGVRYRKAFAVLSQQALSIVVLLLVAGWGISTFFVIREGGVVSHYAAVSRQSGELAAYREYTRDMAR